MRLQERLLSISLLRLMGRGPLPGRRIRIILLQCRVLRQLSLAVGKAISEAKYDFLSMYKLGGV
jgi:hypothetical protein